MHFIFQLSVVESLLYAYKAGLDPIQFFNTIRTGAAGSASMELYAQRIIDGDMKPGFAIDLYMKDLGLALDDCRRMNLVLPGKYLNFIHLFLFFFITFINELFD